MKKGTSTLLFSAVISLASIPAFADSPSTDSNEGFYLGAKLGNMYIDQQNFDDPTSKGFLIGYDFGGFAVELERNTAEADWDFDTGFGSVSGQLDIDTTALYGVYRSEGTVYFKGKVGVINEDIEDEDGESESDTGLTAGVGLGVRAGHLSFEGEFTILETDINLLSLGVNFTF